MSRIIQFLPRPLQNRPEFYAITSSTNVATKIRHAHHAKKHTLTLT